MHERVRLQDLGVHGTALHALACSRLEIRGAGTARGAATGGELARGVSVSRARRPNSGLSGAKLTRSNCPPSEKDGGRADAFVEGSAADPAAGRAHNHGAPPRTRADREARSAGQPCRAGAGTAERGERATGAGRRTRRHRAHLQDAPTGVRAPWCPQLRPGKPNRKPGLLSVNEYSGEPRIRS